LAGETILVVDDDDDIVELITMYMVSEGYNVITAKDGNEALQQNNFTNPDLIILDMMMPGLDGIEVCQEIRKKSQCPIIFLSCKSTPQDKTLGLIAGGDDYMSKPFDSMELLARVKAHLRRNRMIGNPEGISTKASIVCCDNLAINLEHHSVTVGGREVPFSNREFLLLALLAQSPGRVFSNEELYKTIWGAECFGDHRTLIVHISNIRKKIEMDPRKPVFIHTIKGVGYKFLLPDKGNGLP
jgi:DNA-binding response OmpR family regulator